MGLHNLTVFDSKLVGGMNKKIGQRCKCMGAVLKVFFFRKFSRGCNNG